MTTSQIFLYVIAALIVLFYLKRLIQKARMKEYTANQAAKLMNDTSVVLLDVRSIEERKNYHIQESLHIPLNELSKKIASLEAHRNKEIICYCHSGSRSFVAAAMLQKYGFKTANLKGGIIKWNFQNHK